MRENTVDFDLLRKLTAERVEVVSRLCGDYYPLTPYSRDTDRSIAGQFHLYLENRGMIQVFRQEGYVASEYDLQLHGLDLNAEYTVTGHAGEDTMRCTAAGPDIFRVR